MKSGSEERLSYPLHAWLLIGVSWFFYAVVLLILSLFMLPIVPLAPVFVMIMVALGGLLGSVREYARSVASPRQPATVHALFDGKIPHTAPHASAHPSRG